MKVLLSTVGVMLISCLTGIGLRLASKPPTSERRSGVEPPPVATSAEPAIPAGIIDPETSIELWASKCASADLQQVHALASELANDASSSHDHRAWQAVMDQWTTLHPSQALEFSRNHGHLDLDPTLELITFHSWSRTSPEAALEEAKAEAAKIAVLKGIAEVDPDRAIEFLRANPIRSTNIAGVLEILSRTSPEEAANLALDVWSGESSKLAAASWAKQDPNAAWNWANAIVTRHSVKRQARQGVIAEWIKTNPTAAKSAIGSMPASRTRASLTALAGYELAKTSVDDAVRWMNASATTGERNFAFATIAAQLAESDPAKARRFLDELAWNPDNVPDIDSYRIGHGSYGGTTPNLKKIIRSVVKSTFEDNPVAALDLVRAIDHDVTRTGLLTELIDNWAVTEGDGIQDWLSAIPNKNQRQQATLAFGQALARHHVDLLDQNLELFATTKDRIAFAQGATRVLAEEASQAAIDWANGLQEGDRDAVLENLFEHWQTNDWRKAATHADLIAVDATTAHSLMDNIGGDWGNDDPAEMADFLSSQSDPPSKWCGFAAFCLAQKDLAAAEKFVTELPPGQVYDQGAFSMTNALSSFDQTEMNFVAAIDWAQTVSDPEQQSRALKLVSDRWYRKDASSAGDSIKALKLSPELTAQLLQSDSSAK